MEETSQRNTQMMNCVASHGHLKKLNSKGVKLYLCLTN